MNRLLLVAGILAMIAGCAGPVKPGPDARAFDGPGAAGAAMLGYHGPVYRQPVLAYGN